MQDAHSTQWIEFIELCSLVGFVICQDKDRQLRTKGINQNHEDNGVSSTHGASTSHYTFPLRIFLLDIPSIRKLMYSVKLESICSRLIILKYRKRQRIAIVGMRV